MKLTETDIEILKQIAAGGFVYPPIGISLAEAQPVAEKVLLLRFFGYIEVDEIHREEKTGRALIDNFLGPAITEKGMNAIAVRNKIKNK